MRLENGKEKSGQMHKQALGFGAQLHPSPQGCPGLGGEFSTTEKATRGTSSKEGRRLKA